MTGTSR